MEERLILMTIESMCENHRRLWDTMAKIAEDHAPDKTEALLSMGVNYSDIRNYCFACAYAESQGNKVNGISCGRICPFQWIEDKEEAWHTCMHDGSPYSLYIQLYDKAKSFHTNYDDIKDNMVLACKNVRDIPLKSEM